MDITKLATQMLASKLGGSLQSDSLQQVLGGLLGGGQGSDSGLDLGALVGNLKSSDLSGLVESWLGDGANEEVSESQLENFLGRDKIDQAASQLGADSGQLLSGLKELLPQVIDKSSKGGELLEQVGGLSGLASLASRFLK